jgi:predicted ATP-binding protein involved in virulence
LQDRPYFSSKKAVTSDFFPIEYIRIQNFKGISDLTIHFKTDEVEKRSWLFLLGENGVGKSSILQAIAVGIRNNEHVLTPLLPGLIQKGKDRAEITIKERDSDNILTTVLTKEKITQTGEFNSFLIGYGSLRLSVDEADKNLPQDKAGVSYENLFRPIRPLNDITDWLKNTYKDNRKFFDIVAYSIKQLLPHDFPGNDLTIENGEILFRNSNKLFSELSDGFKSTIILAVDIMMKLSSAQADMDKLSGIVLIDELGNQLHPRWQMRIVKQLRTVFKNINFVVSTHHPLCLRGSEKGEILLLKQEDNQVAPVTELPDPASLRVDQILSSEFFGLNSLIDPELEAKFNRYYQLLAKGVESLEGVEQKELGNLKNELRNQKQLGASLREELMYTVIDSLLASKTTLSRSQLKEQVVSRVKDIWDKLNSSSHDQG